MPLRNWYPTVEVAEATVGDYLLVRARANAGLYLGQVIASSACFLTVEYGGAHNNHWTSRFNRKTSEQAGDSRTHRVEPFDFEKYCASLDNLDLDRLRYELTTELENLSLIIRKSRNRGSRPLDPLMLASLVTLLQNTSIQLES